MNTPFVHTCILMHVMKGAPPRGKAQMSKCEGFKNYEWTNVITEMWYSSCMKTWPSAWRCVIHSIYLSIYLSTYLQSTSRTCNNNTPTHWMFNGTNLLIIYKCQDLEPSFVPNFAWSNLNWQWRNVGFLASLARNGKAKIWENVQKMDEKMSSQKRDILWRIKTWPYVRWCVINSINMHLFC